MASVPIDDGDGTAALAKRAPARSFLAAIVALAPIVIMFAVSAVELLLADRKYGLFTGGFGQSRAVDSPAELAVFFIAYLVVQTLIGLAGWWVSVALVKGRPAWTALFVFVLINGVVFCGLLAVQYQLHSYFSDAVGFALLKQLGGGSFTDAIKYALNEIGVAAIAIGMLGAGLWGLWRLLIRWLPSNMPAARKPKKVPVLAALVLALVTLRGGSDAAFGLNRTIAWRSATSALDIASDFDRDGYGLFSIQYDAAPFDSARHPLALDIPGNGVDEDGYGGDLELVALAEPLPQMQLPAAGQTPLNVVIVVMESLRGDVLGKRVNGRVAAPNLEALAAAGDHSPAYSHVGFTTESLKSIFSGRLMPREGDPSLFSDLAANGYRIGIYSGQPESFGNIDAVTGMRQAADQFVDAEDLREKRAFEFAAKGSLLVDEAHLLEAFDSGLGAKNWQQPHFLYFNFQSAHFPYHHDGVEPRLAGEPLPRGDISLENAARVQETYWNAVAHADAALGEVVARLKQRGVWDNTLLLVTGDHGEDLFEDGFLGHGHIINQRQNATLLVSNRPDTLPAGPVALSDYRALITNALTGRSTEQINIAPFAHIGPLYSPTAIGIARSGSDLISLRLDTGEACFTGEGRCLPYASLKGADLQAVDSLIARWGSERWRESQR